MKKVAIVMGSKSDLSVVSEAYDILKRFSVPVVVRVISAHRSIDTVLEFSRGLKDDGFGVVIAAAGKAAHLAGVVAANTSIPVIGLPIRSSTLDGLDSLLSTVQMPSGIPVATVAINGAVNAGILAMQILAVSDQDLYNALCNERVSLKEKQAKDDRSITAQYN
ncbi:MAG: 5-(carboxyamino)imidazole ribonucleotide mutase [Christensenellaceae bacterium]|jgi:5-(carboxyamino)imidazole ribonucleotide mutase|nr:5-(carboxyamino)imidazole ribonucleotide mutase [Christensenellaceae bacterium]